MQRSFDYKSTG